MREKGEVKGRQTDIQTKKSDSESARAKDEKERNIE